MSVFQGVIDGAGGVVRRQGNFTVSMVSGQFTIEVLGQNLDRAFILATPWAKVGDALGGSYIDAVVGFPGKAKVLFEVRPGFGVSFRIQT